MKVWISSASGSIARAPDSISLKIPFRPSAIAARSSSDIMPRFASMAECARLPAISCLYIRLSVRMEELKSFVMLLICL